MNRETYDLLYSYHSKWSEYFEVIEPGARWEAMACLLASELCKEQKMRDYYETLADFRDRRITKNV